MPLIDLREHGTISLNLQHERTPVLNDNGLKLEKELLDMIVEVCRILDPVPDDMSPEDPLFGPDSVFGLDSLDAVEIVVAVEARYKVRLGADEASRKVFRSLRTLADYIRAERQSGQPASDL
jgi:acyl carrier protein